VLIHGCRPRFEGRLFPDDFHAEVQVIITLISADKNIMPDALAGLAASAALAVSDFLFSDRSLIRWARDQWPVCVNPTFRPCQWPILYSGRRNHGTS